MNKIRLYNDYIKETNVDDSIQIEKVRKTELFAVNQLKIKVVKDSNLLIEFDADKEIKLDIYIEVLDNIKCQLKEEKSNLNSKIRYTYILNKGSKLDLSKEYFNNDIRELNLIYLNNESTLNYNVNTISKQRERYDMILYQNNNNSICDISLKVLNLTSLFSLNINNFEEGINNKVSFSTNIITKDIDLCKINADIENTLKQEIIVKEINDKDVYIKEFRDNKFIDKI